MADRPAPRSPLLFRRWAFRGARPVHGGGTTSPQTGEHHEGSGYGVAAGDNTAAISHAGSHGRRVAHEKAAQERLARRHPAELRSGYYVGSWRQGDKVHYDPTEVVGDLATAMERAKARGQLAIYDFKNQRDIKVT